MKEDIELARIVLSPRANIRKVFENVSVMGDLPAFTA